MVERVIMGQRKVIELSHELRRREPPQPSPGAASNSNQSMQADYVQVEHERWFSILLSASTVVMMLNRLLVALGVQDSEGAESRAQELARCVLADNARHCETAKWHTNAHFIVPGCKAILSTAAEWTALSVRVDEFSATVATPEMFQRWLSLAGMATLLSARK